MTVQESALDTSNDVVVIPIETISEANAPSIFGHNALNRFVELARDTVIGEVPDLSTDKGRKRVKSVAASVASAKNAVDKAGRDYLRKLKAMTKPIEAELRDFNAAMDALRDEVRKPVDDWDAAREAEKAAVQSAIDQVVANFTLPADADVDTIVGALFGLEQEPLTEEMFGKRLEEAEAKRAYGITVLNEQLAKRQQYDQEQAELVTGRARIAALEEQARLLAVANQAVEDERLRVANQQQQQRNADALRLSEAEDTARKTQEALQKVIDDQAKKEQTEREAREQQEREDAARIADKAYRGKINRAALDALRAINVAPEGQREAFLSPAVATQIMSAIIRGQIPAVSISY
jgi:septal ring factor EnvC (AmiA/AmiB activator)